MKKKTYDPTAQQVEQELNRERYKKRYRSTLKSTVYVLISAAAVAVLVATLWMPVLQIFGSSMAPTLQEGQIVVSLKGTDFEPGDIVAFYYGNRLLVKRYIAGPGSWVDIDEEGNVTVDGMPLAEPYLQEKALGATDLEFPYQVPDEKYFLMGDNRETSVDSRHSAVGCVSEEQIVGEIVFRIWPFDSFGQLGE